MTGTYPMAHGVRDNGIVLRAGGIKRRWRARSRRPGTPRAPSSAPSSSIPAGGSTRDSIAMWTISTCRKAPWSARIWFAIAAKTVVANARTWLDQVKGGPFFAWVHLFDPHAPYDPPEPYRSQYGNAPWGLYHAEVAHVDNLVGQLLDWLAQNESGGDDRCRVRGRPRREPRAGMASRAMGSSCTTPRFMCRSFSGSPISRPAGGSPPRSARSTSCPPC